MAMLSTALSLAFFFQLQTPKPDTILLTHRLFTTSLALLEGTLRVL